MRLDCVLLLSFISSLFPISGRVALFGIKMGRKKQKKRKCYASTSSVENEVENENCVSCKEAIENDAVECYWCSNWQHNY